MALLATLALLAAPVRPALACAMPDAARAGLSAGAAASVADAGAGHAHHDAEPEVPAHAAAHAGPHTGSGVPLPDPAGHDRCPDLAACAVVALGATPTRSADPVSTAERVAGEDSARPDAPVAAVEPPPPRA